MIRSLFAVLSLAAFAAAGASAQAQPMRTTWTTYLRAGPGRQYDVLDEIGSLTVVDVLGCADGWCRVRLDDAEGYVAADLIEPPTTQAAPASVGGSCFRTQLSGYKGHEATEFCAR